MSAVVLYLISVFILTSNIAHAAIPATGLFSQYSAESYSTQTPALWKDSSGNARDAAVTGISVTTDEFGKTIITGSITSTVVFPTAGLGSNYTLFYRAKYNGANKGRIFTWTIGNGETCDWLSGFYEGLSGVAYRGGTWLTPLEDKFGSSWVVGTDQTRLYRGNGVQLSIRNAPYGYFCGLAINVNYYDSINVNYYDSNGASDFAVSDVIIYSRVLSLTEILQVEATLLPNQPSTAPSAAPSQPTRAPSAAPSAVPSQPSSDPTADPTTVPSTAPSQPTTAPTTAPSQPTTAPTIAPSQPTIVPSTAPTTVPSKPTTAPSAAPSQPTPAPTRAPSQPTTDPTTAPSQPTTAPSAAPSQPTPAPTRAPSKPTTAPTTVPSKPTIAPSAAPSIPTAAPSRAPSQPTTAPTASPTTAPSLPTAPPTTAPSNPTTAPTRAPSKPTTAPTRAPSKPTTAPSRKPSNSPTFPLIPGLFSQYSADSYSTQTPAIWKDSSGNARDAAVTGISIATDEFGKTIITGSRKSTVVFPTAGLGSNYTLFYRAKYNGANKGIIFTWSIGNYETCDWLSGFYNRMSGVAFRGGMWLTPQVDRFGSNWVVGTDQGRLYRGNGVQLSVRDAPYNYSCGLAINANYYHPNGSSDFAVSDVIVYSRELSLAEILQVETALNLHRPSYTPSRAPTLLQTSTAPAYNYPIAPWQPSYTSTSSYTTSNALTPGDIFMIVFFPIFFLIFLAALFFVFVVKKSNPQVQPTAPTSEPTSQSTNDGNYNNSSTAVQTQLTIERDINPTQHQLQPQQPYTMAQSGYTPLQPQQGNQPQQVHDRYGQPQPYQQPQVNGYMQPQSEPYGHESYGQTYSNQVYSFVQPQQPEPQPNQVYGYVQPQPGSQVHNRYGQPQLSHQPQPQVYGEPGPQVNDYYGQPQASQQSQPQVYSQPGPQVYDQYGQPQPNQQPQPQVYGYIQPGQQPQLQVHDHYGQPQPNQVIGYVQPQLQVQPQVYYNNNAQVQIPQQQQQPSGAEYHLQPQLYDPSMVYPAVAAPMFNQPSKR